WSLLVVEGGVSPCTSPIVNLINLYWRRTMVFHSDVRKLPKKIQKKLKLLWEDEMPDAECRDRWATMGRQMSPKNPSLHDATSAGGREEARRHNVIGYQAGQALIATTHVFVRQAGKPLDLRSVEYSVRTLINENPGSTSAQLAQALAVSAPNITAWI